MSTVEAPENVAILNFARNTPKLSVDEVEIKYRYNPHVEYIKLYLLHWLPAFFYIMDRAVQEAHRKP